PSVFIENVFAKPSDVLSGHPGLDVDCFLQHTEAAREPLTLEVELRDGDRVISKASQKLPPAEASAEPVSHTVRLENLSGIKLWDLVSPNLYSVHVRLLRGGKLSDSDTRRVGFRKAEFTDHGFE